MTTANFSFLKLDEKKRKLRKPKLFTHKMATKSKVYTEQDLKLPPIKVTFYYLRDFKNRRFCL